MGDVFCKPGACLRGVYPFKFATTDPHTHRLPTVEALEADGWTRVKPVPGMPDVWLMRRVPAE